MTQKEMQQLLIDNGFTKVHVINKDNVWIMVDWEKQFIRSDDKVTGQGGSGLRWFAGFYGDHRMIQEIADEMEQVFKLLNPQPDEHKIH